MNVIKDAQYWKEYNLKRKLYIQQKNKERYLTSKGINTTTQLIQPNLNINTTKINTTDNLIPPINTTEEKVVDITTYNEKVYQRAGTREETRFYTFINGKKIVRTKCGCAGYNWCLDNCSYFTTWRNEAIKVHE